MVRLIELAASFLTNYFGGIDGYLNSQKNNAVIKLKNGVFGDLVIYESTSSEKRIVHITDQRVGFLYDYYNAISGAFEMADKSSGVRWRSIPPYDWVANKVVLGEFLGIKIPTNLIKGADKYVQSSENIINALGLVEPKIANYGAIGLQHSTYYRYDEGFAAFIPKSSSLQGKCFFLSYGSTISWIPDPHNEGDRINTTKIPASDLYTSIAIILMSHNSLMEYMPGNAEGVLEKQIQDAYRAAREKLMR